MAQARGINPPVPRRLVSQSPVPGILPTTCQDPLGPMPRSRVGGKLEEIRDNTSTGFQFCQLLGQPVDQSGIAHSREVVGATTKVTFCQDQGQLHRQTILVPDRSSHSHRKTGLVRSSSHETHTVASEATLACSEDLGKSHSHSSISPPTSRLVVRQEKCTPWSTIVPLKASPTGVYGHLK